MVFKSPSYISELITEPPSNVPILDFLFPAKGGDARGRYPVEKSRNPFTCGITGKTYSITDVRERVEHLARSLAKVMDAKVDEGSEMDKVVGVFTVNAVSRRN